MKLQEFYAQLEEKAQTAETVEELNEEVSNMIEAYNDMPLDAFAGLSANQMHNLLYFPLESGSPVLLHQDIPDPVLDRLPFFRLTEELLKIIRRERGIRLTKTGALPIAVLKEIYSHGFIPIRAIDEGIGKIRREDDYAVFLSLNANTRLTGLVRKTHDRLFLTKKCEKLITSNSRNDLFHIIFRTFANKFNWAYNDGYPEFPIGSFAYGLSIYLVAKYGNIARPHAFYSDKFLAAFPSSLASFRETSFRSPEKLFADCYEVRTFSRFLEWFNLVEAIHSVNGSRRESTVKATDLFTSVFEIL